jgi:protein-L-isoaspartate(D-aspartate) O-methyltransferase
MKTQEQMIEEQIKARGIYNNRVLNAIRAVDRADFIPDEMLPHAYEDCPLPIGKGQTISQPYIVAYMADVLDLSPDAKVLEVGTGCGYNAAVLSRIASQVYSIEIIDWLGKYGKENLEKAGIDNVQTKIGDGYEGWPEKGPFDAIILTAAPPYIPNPLKQQLKIGGKLLAPIGKEIQQLIRLEKTSEDTYHQETLLMVKFVPMTGEAQR